MKPFDLEAAKRGEPILWHGAPARFIAYVPETDEVVVLGNGCSTAEVLHVTCCVSLTMAPRMVLSVPYKRYAEECDGKLYVRIMQGDRPHGPLPQSCRWLDDEWVTETVAL